MEDPFLAGLGRQCRDASPDLAHCAGCTFLNSSLNVVPPAPAPCRSAGEEGEGILLCTNENADTGRTNLFIMNNGSSGMGGHSP